ncbi:potassium-transporting ATPase A chain [Variibacter gotjawalensis]|uniref:Potassium-transporting ATPase potassium-binding subunit n=1 Tax=Variibacter gotjawalensis TaxID=1333996 RepID=A0A0S3PR77_9BRAD|nr:potassium-transporting ATPase subunit KdpA [Variibacter gotjawalensis]NIK48765.1 K+-transporting ATPase ATPase A chain [Variibacter gotjawalensis]RZS50626.1 K+-transporting ATPase ATPase A chain [Variibacter gotjawalensis]BAT58459.1 potassium-transporting ATPase A chain [Variibacter gotjawalensis]
MINDLTQAALFAALLVALAIPLGLYMARVFTGDMTFLAPVERALLGPAGVNTGEGQHWTRYALSLIAFNAAGFALLFVILRYQNLLPLNPQGFDGMSAHLAFNTAISFVTNTNWQSYGGESTLSHFSQMAGLTTQNFVSAASGMAVAAAVARGLASRQQRTIGNFWVDLVRATLYVLLPLSIILAIAMVWFGSPQTLAASADATTLEGAKQTIALGPVASQIAIKQLGTNGGGFFNANSAHPFENPTAISNLITMIAILIIPVAFCFTYGRMVRDTRQGIALFAAMGVLIVIAFTGLYAAERYGNPSIAAYADPAGGSMEGKEVRFGIIGSVLWAVSTTAASNGSVNAMHDSLTPLGGLIAMLNIQLGEVVYGGAGVGLTGMLLFVILTVFLAGLMVGRTPEYLGKKIEAREVKLAALTLMIMPIGVLVLCGLAILVGTAQSSVQDAGPHGLSELLYAYSSATGNNGSAFAGFNANVGWHNVFLGISMMLGRFGYIIPILAIAGSLAGKKTAAASAGTFPTHGIVFVVLLVVTILIVGALTFLPVLALGPIAEHVSMLAGKVF